jgi:hypothetical protein
MHTDHTPVLGSVEHETTLLDCETWLMFLPEDRPYLHALLFAVWSGSGSHLPEGKGRMVSVSIQMVCEQSLMTVMCRTMSELQEARPPDVLYSC